MTAKFHPNTRSPKIEVCWVESVHQLGQILDGYANMSRVPIRLLRVHLYGKFERLNGAPARSGEFLFIDFLFDKGETLIQAHIDGFKTIVRPTGRFDVTIEG